MLFLLQVALTGKTCLPNCKSGSADSDLTLPPHVARRKHESVFGSEQEVSPLALESQASATAS
jgi:hypothetical protein